MKNVLFIILLICSISCMERNNQTDLRKEIDRIKREELPNKTYSITQFDISTYEEYAFFSEIISKSDKGIKSVKIITKFKIDDSLISKTESEEYQNYLFDYQFILPNEKKPPYLIYRLISDTNDTISVTLKPKKNKLISVKFDPKNVLRSTLDLDYP